MGFLTDKPGEFPVSILISGESSATVMGNVIYRTMQMIEEAFPGSMDVAMMVKDKLSIEDLFRRMGFKVR